MEDLNFIYKVLRVRFYVLKLGYSMSPDHRLCPSTEWTCFSWSGLASTLSDFHKGADKIYPNASSLVVAFSSLICANSHYVARERFAYCGVIVERSLAKQDN